MHIPVNGRIVSLVGLVMAAAGCPTDDGPPPGPQTVWEVDDTTVAFSLSPFGWTVTRGDDEVSRSRSGQGHCAPLAMGLRPFDDSGGRFHRPDAPGDDVVWLTSGDAEATDDGLVVTLASADGAFESEAVVEVTGSGEYVQLTVRTDENPRALALFSFCMDFHDDEHAVGGGERFESPDLAGRTIPLYLLAPGPYDSGTNETHAPVPFLATSRDLGLVLDSEAPAAFDVGDTDPEALLVRTQDPAPRLLLRAGADMVDSAAAHARRMGLPPMPPDWALAPQQWRNEHALTLDDDGNVIKSGQDRVIEDAETMRALDLPATAMWIDAPWSTGYTTFAFNPVQFPDPPAMFARLDELGYRAIVWATDNVNRSDDSDQQVGMEPYATLDLYNDYASQGYLVQTQSGEPFNFPWGRGEGGYLDFTNPDAVAAWRAMMRPLLELGVRGFKLDYGETMRPNLLTLENDLVAFADGSTARTMHTRHARLYHEAFIAELSEVHPDDWFIITRTGGVYDQKNGVAIWPGDLDNDFAEAGLVNDEGALTVGGLPAGISGAVSSSMSGYPLYGSDIGGYRGGAPDRDVYLRWIAAGTMQTIMQLGGGGTGDVTHNPWEQLDDGTYRYGEDAVDIYRGYARWRIRWFPVWKQVLLDATTRGTPPLRPTGAMAPEEPAAWADRYSYFVGEHILVAPAIDAATTREVFIPPGRFCRYETGACVDGPAVQSFDVALDELLVFVEAGTAVAEMGPDLVTLVNDAGPDVGDLAAAGSARQLRLYPADRPTDTTLLDGIDVHLEDGLADVQSEDARRFVVWWMAPGATTLAVDGNAVPEVAADAIYTCEPPCASVLDGVPVVAVTGSSFSVAATN